MGSASPAVLVAGYRIACYLPMHAKQLPAQSHPGGHRECSLGAADTVTSGHAAIPLLPYAVTAC